MIDGTIKLSGSFHEGDFVSILMESPPDLCHATMRLEPDEPPCGITGIIWSLTQREPVDRRSWPSKQFLTSVMLEWKDEPSMEPGITTAFLPCVVRWHRGRRGVGRVLEPPRPVLSGWFRLLVWVIRVPS